MSLRTVSWVLLALVGVLVLLGSLASAGLAYRGDFPIGGVSIAVGPRVTAAHRLASPTELRSWLAAFVTRERGE